MRRTNHKTIKVGIVLTLGLLAVSGGVQADPVLDCQVAKVRAARSRATCLANQQEKKLTGKRFNFAACETRFNNNIAAADTAQQGAACRYIDNGDGTVSDLNTLLTWEQKVSGSSTSFEFDSQGVGNCLHCVRDIYPWNTAVSEWLSALNGRTASSIVQTGLAGFEDWRVPTHFELRAILKPLGTCKPCIDPIFGASPVSFDWSSTSGALDPTHAWVVFLGGNGVYGLHVKNKRTELNFGLPVRAVRGPGRSPQSLDQLHQGGVQADPVLDCQVAKVRAAGSRATCLANQQEKKLSGKPFNFAACETRFNNNIAAADTAQQGAACRYIDNGDGTVSDLNTLLTWEQKMPESSTSFDSQGVGNCFHCVRDIYPWNTAVSEWLSALNGRTDDSIAQRGLAGFEDWRVPTHIELQTILEPFPCSPCIDPIFGPGPASFDWSSTSDALDLASAWVVFFGNGVDVGLGVKRFGFQVRAVRGGR